MFGRAGSVVLRRRGLALWYNGDVMRYFEYRIGGVAVCAGVIQYSMLSPQAR